MVSLSTGISLADECISEFTALRMKRTHRYLIMKVNDEKSHIVIDKLGARDETFEQFKENMPKDQTRYESSLFSHISTLHFERTW